MGKSTAPHRRIDVEPGVYVLVFLDGRRERYEFAMKNGFQRSRVRNDDRRGGSRTYIAPREPDDNA